MTSAIIVAAGSGSRMGFDKLMASLGGSPVILRTLEAFQVCPEIDEIILVCPPDRAEVIHRLADDGEMRKIRRIVPGGAERHLSVWAGLQAVSAGSSHVAVHDGARPLIHPSQISRCLARAWDTGAVASARPVSETLKQADASGLVTGSVNREGLWIMETPQVFARTLLVSAYEAVLRDGLLVTDEVSALGHIGHDVWLVDNPTPNPKITWPPDLALAERLLSPT
jgi:2-C-methyl-D-erythritol 4-phosphate cytidylyltransferase